MTLRFDLVILLSDESNRIDGEIDDEDISILFTTTLLRFIISLFSTPPSHSPVLSRFDLVILLSDESNRIDGEIDDERDRLVADHILAEARGDPELPRSEERW